MSNCLHIPLQDKKFEELKKKGCTLQCSNCHQWLMFASEDLRQLVAKIFD